LIDFIRQLAIEEHLHHQHPIETVLPQPQTFEQALEQYQRIDHLWNDEIDATKLGWQKRYYHHFFHLPFNDPLCDQIKDICRQYLVTLEWNVCYYFNRCDDWQWLYPFEATPLLTDFLNYLISEKPNPTLFPVRDPVPPFHQLLMILPPQSAHLLPLPYQPFMVSIDSPLIHYFPSHVELELYGHRFRWEAHPKIPFMVPDEVTSVVSVVESQLTEEECERGSLGQPIKM
jgi:5'-3' exonuclease